MRYALPLLLMFLPVTLAGDRLDCGLRAGERYWITRAGLIFPDGSIREDWYNCELMQGVTFSILWDDASPDPVSAFDVPLVVSTRRYRVESHSDCTGTPDEQHARSQRQAERIRDQLLAEQGVLWENVELLALGCTHPLVSPEVTEEDRKKNRRVEVILLGP